MIATKSGRLSVRILDQVKKFARGHLVRHDDVRALLGVLSGDLRASKAVLTTTSDFAPGIITEPGIAAFLPTRLELRNGHELRAWLKEIGQAK